VRGFKQERSRHDVPKPSQIRDRPCGHVAEHSRDVFEEEEPRLIRLKNSHGRRPEVAGIVGAELLAGNAVRLAGDAAKHEVDSLAACSRANVSAELCIADGFRVRPDRRDSQGFFFHARCKDCRCVGFPLHVRNGSEDARAGELDGKVESADPGTD